LSRGLRWSWNGWLRLRIRCNGSDEAVPAAGNRFNETRVLGIVVNGGAKFLEDDVEATVKVDIGAFGPESLAQLFTRNDFACPFQQKNQDPEGLVLNLDAYTVAHQRAIGRICLEQSKTEDIWRRYCSLHGGYRNVGDHSTMI